MASLPDAPAKPDRMVASLSGTSYKDGIEDSSSYNALLKKANQTRSDGGRLTVGVSSSASTRGLGDALPAGPPAERGGLQVSDAGSDPDLSLLLLSMCPRRVDGASDGGDQVRREAGCVLTLIYLLTSLHVLP